MAQLNENTLSSKEIRSVAQRAEDLAVDLPKQVLNAKENCRGYSRILEHIDPKEITSTEDLQKIPVLRKSELIELQKIDPPFGGFLTEKIKVDNIFQSPGPIYDPGFQKTDWWSLSRFLNAVGISSMDVVQNCFSYHFTPAGKMMESAALSLGATVFPAGVGNTEQQAQVAASLGITSYCGTPEYLLMILEKADELSLDVSKINKAAVSGGPLFPELRQKYNQRGIKCLQAYAIADIGAIAYETVADEPMIVDENIILEIVTPGSGSPISNGEIGEVLVTSLNPDYPLIRFATGDLSSIAPGKSSCGRTNIRIVGWRGRADQATKIRGMFVRPEQITIFRERHPEIIKARVVVNLVDNKDQMILKVEVKNVAVASDKYVESFRNIVKLGAQVEIVPEGTLQRDGLVIEDCRPKPSQKNS